MVVHWGHSVIGSRPDEREQGWRWWWVVVRGALLVPSGSGARGALSDELRQGPKRRKRPDGAFVSWILDGRGLFEPTNRGFLSLGGWREKKLLGGVVWWQIC